jgi:CspA family cold shock protein
MRMTGTVKWYDEAKGYGFIAVDGLGDVLVHRVVLMEAGIASVNEGATIECEAIQRPKGWQAKQIYSIDDSTAKEARPRQKPSPARHPQGELFAFAEPDVAVVAKVKWFSRPKGYGFLTVTGRDEDVFVHSDILRHCGLRDLTLGQRLLVRIIRGPKGLTAIEVFDLTESELTEEQSPPLSLGSAAKHEPKMMQGIVGDLLLINEERGYGVVMLHEIKDVAHVPIELLRAAGITAVGECGKLLCDIEFAPTITIVRRLTRLN